MENKHFKQRENPAKSLINLFFFPPKPVLKASQFVDANNTATVKCVCNHSSALLVHTADRRVKAKQSKTLKSPHSQIF